jgi:hypothetical protein
MLVCNRRHCAPARFAVAVAAAALLATPAVAGPPFRTDDPEPVEHQHWELDFFSAGTKVKGDTSGVLPGVEANYGLFPDVQVHLIVPLAFDMPSGGATNFGIGDTEFGVKYCFINPGEGDWWPQVAVFPLVTASTGSAKRGLGAGVTREFLPVWLQKDFCDWTVYGGGGYMVNPGRGNRNFWFTGVAVWRKVTEELNLGAEVFHQTKDASDAKDSTGFNVGAIYDISENWHILASAGRGSQNVSDTNQFSYYLGLQLTF